MADNNQKNNKQQPQNTNQLRKVRVEKLETLQEMGKDPFQVVKYDQEQHSAEIKENFEKYEDKDVSIAGRMMFKRVMGKASFANIQDRDGRIQIYVSRDDLGDDNYKLFKKMDVGDILGVKGFVFRPAPVKSPSTLKRSPCSRSRFTRCRRSSTDSRIRTSATASATWTSS